MPEGSSNSFVHLYCAAPIANKYKPHDSQFFLIILFPDLKEDDTNMIKSGPKPFNLGEKTLEGVICELQKRRWWINLSFFFHLFPLTEPSAFFSACKLLTAMESHLELISFALTVKYETESLSLSKDSDKVDQPKTKH